MGSTIRTSILVPKWVWRLVNIGFFETAFLTLAMYAISLIPPQRPRPHSWLLGDWFINYQGGFVRRGLAGEIFLGVSSLLGIRIEILVVIVLMLLYLAFVTNACRLSMGSSFNPINAMLVFSPAFMLFPILDSQAGFRKELLLFTLISTLCMLLARSRAKIPRYLPLCTGLVCAALVLSHEMLIVFLPYLLCPFIIHERGFGVATRRAILFMTPAAILVVAVATLGQGSQQTVSAICESLKTSAPVDCLSPGTLPGAITFLAKNLASAHAFVLESNPPPTLLVYGASAILSFTPLVLKIRTGEFRESLDGTHVGFWLAVCIGSALVASLPLLWIVADYGRLIHIHVVCLTLLTLMATQEHNNEPLRFRLGLPNIAIWLVCLLFIGSWRLIHRGASAQSSFVLYSMIRSALGL